MKSFDPSEFFAAVRPVAERVIAETGFTVKRGNVFARALNLAMGHTAKTRAEKAFQDRLLAEIEAAYPDDSGPVLHEDRPSSEDHANLFRKVDPIIFELSREYGPHLNGTARGINLAIGCKPRTRMERLFQEKLWETLAERYPGDAYPSQCPRPKSQAQSEGPKRWLIPAELIDESMTRELGGA